MKRYILSSTLLLILFPSIAYAEVRFTEVMYDLEGADSEREWVEVCNLGTDTVDLSGWKFFENGTNHGLTEASGGASLSAGSCAIIADNASTFLSEHGGFSGVLFDSSFSLANTTETTALRNADLVDVDTFTYNSDMGAAGDGNSLQNNSGTWVAASPTPGSVELGTTSNSQEEETQAADTTIDSETDTESMTTQSSDEKGAQSSFPVTPQVFADAGSNYSGVSGGPILFKGQAVGKKGEPLVNARYSWTFGDGTVGEGKEVYHTYMYPGKYRVVLNVSSGFNSGSDMTIAGISNAIISISKVEIGEAGFIELKNASQKELDISGWILSGNGREFVIPQGTFILAGQSVALSAQMTGVPVGQGDRVLLLYPNRTEASKYTWPSAKGTLVNTIAQKAATPTNITTSPSSKVAAKEILPQEKDAISDANLKEEQEADVSTSFEGESGSLYPWLLGLVLLAGVGASSVFLIKPKQIEEANPFGKEAQEYEIIEEK